PRRPAGPRRPRSGSGPPPARRAATAMTTKREEQRFLLIAILIGIYSGLAVVCFRLAIEWTRLAVFGSQFRPAVPRTVIVPAIGGLLVAALVVRFFPVVRGSGVNQTKAAL